MKPEKAFKAAISIHGIGLLLLLTLLPSVLQGCSSGGVKWKTRDKLLFSTFTSLNMSDMGQTYYAFNHPDEFKEANPVLSKDTYIPILLAANILVYYLADNVFDEERTWFLAPLVVLKAFAVGNNLSVMGFEFAK